MGEGIVRELRIGMYTLLSIKWITIKVLLHMYMELCLMLCGTLDGRGVWGRLDTWIYRAGVPPLLPETIMMFLIGYTPIQTKCLKVTKQKNKRRTLSLSWAMHSLETLMKTTRTSAGTNSQVPPPQVATPGRVFYSHANSPWTDNPILRDRSALKTMPSLLKKNI